MCMDLKEAWLQWIGLQTRHLAKIHLDDHYYEILGCRIVQFVLKIDDPYFVKQHLVQKLETYEYYLLFHNVSMQDTTICYCLGEFNIQWISPYRGNDQANSSTRWQYEIHMRPLLVYFTSRCRTKID